jgi:hypothetical protein
MAMKVIVPREAGRVVYSGGVTCIITRPLIDLILTLFTQRGVQADHQKDKGCEKNEAYNGK